MPDRKNLGGHPATISWERVCRIVYAIEVLQWRPTKVAREFKVSRTTVWRIRHPERYPRYRGAQPLPFNPARPLAGLAEFSR